MRGMLAARGFCVQEQRIREAMIRVDPLGVTCDGLYLCIDGPTGCSVQIHCGTSMEPCSYLMENGCTWWDRWIQ